MSLQLISDFSNEIEMIADAHGNLWFKRAHVGKYLGIRDIKHNFKDFPLDYTRPRSSIFSLSECEMSTRNAVRPGHKDQKNKWDIFLLRRGLLYVINKCRKATPNLINLIKCLGIKLHKNKWLYKEQNTLSQIMQTFNDEEMIHHLSVGKYRIDQYFPRHKLAIECDEFDHRDRDIEYEIRRQKFIEDQLSCKVIRYNPDAEGFYILEVVNKIFVHIKSSFQK